MKPSEELMELVEELTRLQAKVILEIRAEADFMPTRNKKDEVLARIQKIADSLDNYKTVIDKLGIKIND